jgi:excisionase family DNA binding protein
MLRFITRWPVGFSPQFDPMRFLKLTDSPAGLLQEEAMSSCALSILNVSRILSVSENTTRRLVRSGQIRASRVGQQWRVTEADLRAFLWEKSNRAIVDVDNVGAAGHTAARSAEQSSRRDR